MQKASLDPLPEDGLASLYKLLDERSPFDGAGLLGVLHAVAVAPGMIAPSAWLPLVFPDGFGDLDAAGVEKVAGLAMLLLNVVLESVRTRAMDLVPGEGDVEECASFARGFIAGAELDPSWIGDDERWTFASWAAYLGGRDDLVSADVRAKIESMNDPQRATRRTMPALLNAAYDALRGDRPGQPARKGPRIGRNDPCPCGSGKKFKRCCIDRPASDTD
jgi:hypothetical protein